MDTRAVPVEVPGSTDFGTSMQGLVQTIKEISSKNPRCKDLICKDERSL